MDASTLESNQTLRRLLNQYAAPTAGQVVAAASDQNCLTSHGRCPDLSSSVLKSGLLDAPILGLGIAPEGVVIRLGLDALPDAACLSRMEGELAALFRSPVVQLRLSFQADVGTPTETAYHLLPWLIDDWTGSHGFAATILRGSRIDLADDTMLIRLPEPLRQTVDRAFLTEIERFFLERAGCRAQVRVDADRFDREAAIRNMTRQMMQNVARLPVSHAAADGGEAPPWAVSPGNNQPGRSDRTGTGGQAKTETSKYQAQRPRYKKKDDVLYGKVSRDLAPTSMAELNLDTGLARFTGQVVNFESKLVSRGQKVLLKFDAFGTDGAIACRMFVKPEEAEALEPVLDKSPWCSFEGDVAYNQFDRDLTATIRGLEMAAPPPRRADRAAEKRVELHCHTRMSSQDAMAGAAEIVELAAAFGHPAVAITDHGVVQSFPEACETAARINKNGQTLKLIYGMEGYLVEDGPTCVYSIDEPELGDSFVAIDLETTGLDPADDRIIEIAAVRFRRQTGIGFAADESDVFRTMINPGCSLPPKTIELTGITDMDLIGAPACFGVLAELKDFIGDDPIVGHNVLFDLNFLRYEGFRTEAENDPRIHFNPIAIDTLSLARFALPELRNHKLNTVAEHLGIRLEHHHRAYDDARCCGEIFARIYRRLDEPALPELNRRMGHIERDGIMQRRIPVYHIILLVKDYVGLYYLYRLVSESHTKYFNHRPRIPRSLLTYCRPGLMFGSACEAGEVFRMVKQVYQQCGSQFEPAADMLRQYTYKKTARYYDYLEIQPLTNNQYLLRVPDNGIDTEQDLINLNRLILELGSAAGRKVVATCDSHFKNREDSIYRTIMQANMGFKDAERQPEVYFRSTDEMLDCFRSYLNEEQTHEVVIANPNAIADQIQGGMRPFPDGSFPPLIASAGDEVIRLTWETARSLYEKDGVLPDLVTRRIEKELKSIIDNGFAVMYYIAYRLVKKSNEDGYIVGSRGSVGSSLVAGLCGITEVNPLAPHYRCAQCHYSEFMENGEYGSGFDLPSKNCPECGAPLIRDGQDIPFETFLGFDGDKQPDIDLNFSGEYQPRAHQYVVTMFGPTHTYRAGTIGSYAEKNAEGLVRSYLEKQNKTVNRARIRQMASGLNGVKRTTGQHPGGIVVIPKEREVYDFTPVQYPANDLDAAMTTTHFDFNSMHDTILKLDILGHMDPTMLKMLGDITGQDIVSIPIPDDQVMELFRSAEPLGIRPGTTSTDSGTLGLPELGTPMARDMIRETTPTRFYNLVQLMGLSHGTDVWKGNAQDLIREGTCTIDQVIGCRDGIMTSLIYYGLPAKASFDIMEKVRKGKGLTPDQEQLMREHQVPEWYIESCKKIKYMFPKAHAAAYSISSLRIAWFKVYHPEAFYSAYFTVRSQRQFDASVMCRPLPEIRLEMERLQQLIHNFEGGEKEKKMVELLELVEEMYARGISFLPVDIMASEATRFVVAEKGLIRPPFDTLPGISTSQGEKIVEARRDGPFKSQEELSRRCGLGPTAIQVLNEAGCCADLPATDQIDLFSLMR